VVFEGLDGYRSITTLADALGENVLLADRLDGEPLNSKHGAPLRLLSPDQYGYVSTKHLCRIEVHDRQPRLRYHRDRAIDLRLQALKPHGRANVWREERHRYLPGWFVRPIYRRIGEAIKRGRMTRPASER